MFRFLPHTSHWKIDQGDMPVSNPLKGWACWGENLSQDPSVTLAYVPVYWDELEPEEGVYDFEALEQRCHFAQWRARGTRLIFRLVTDLPEEESKMNIPRWLYEAMDKAGTWYENDYGRGFSPDYENPVFMEAHHRLIAALGARYNDDPQVAFIQLGSLGHWGEWHVDRSAGIDPFPDSTVTDQYVQAYMDAFPDKKLLLRRPYAIVSRAGLGLYDDTFGEPDRHAEWMDWIENGYISSQNGQQLPGAPDFWLAAPSGGEIASYRDISWYFEDSFENTLAAIRESHTTYLGPHSPKADELSAAGWENARTCAQTMGYCLTIDQCSLTQQRGKDKKLSIHWKNMGVAPFYEDWDIRIILRDEDGDVLWQALYPEKISDWGTEAEFSRTLAGTAGLDAATVSVWVGLVDPMTGNCGVQLAVDAKCAEGMYCLGNAGNLR